MWAEHTADELAEDSDCEKQLKKAGLKQRREQQPTQRGSVAARTQCYLVAQPLCGVPLTYPRIFVATAAA